MRYHLALGQVRHGMLCELRRGHDVHWKGPSSTDLHAVIPGAFNMEYWIIKPLTQPSWRKQPSQGLSHREMSFTARVIPPSDIEHGLAVTCTPDSGAISGHLSIRAGCRTVTQLNPQSLADLSMRNRCL